jgi:hypothetical protein
MGKPKRKSLELELKAVVTYCFRYGLGFKGFCPHRKHGYCILSGQVCKSSFDILVLLPP